MATVVSGANCQRQRLARQIKPKQRLLKRPRNNPPRDSASSTATCTTSLPNVEVLFPYLPRQYVEQSKDFGLMAPQHALYKHAGRPRSSRTCGRASEGRTRPGHRP